MNKTIVIVIAAVALFMIVPQTRSIVLSAIGPVPCSLAPYDAKCYCDTGFVRRGVWDNPGMYGNVCLPENPVIDYDGVDIDTEALAYAKMELNNRFPGCDTVSCTGSVNNDPVNPVVRDAWDVWGNRLVDVECVGLSGQPYWMITINMGTGDVPYAVCVGTDGSIHS
jgi:hypothetical protein